MTRDKRYPAFLLISAVLLFAFYLGYPGPFLEKAFNPSVPLEDPAAVQGVNAEGPLPAGPSASVLPVFPLDINKASVEDLMLLPGIGGKTARRIVEKRTELNGFRTVDDLTAVKWVGKVKLANIRGLVVAGSSGAEPRDGPRQPSQK